MIVLEADQSLGIYGKKCYRHGEDPDLRVQFEQWYKAGEKSLITEKLFTGNIVEQVYAVEYTHKFYKDGYQLTLGELHQINKIRHSHEIIQTCDGCLFMVEYASTIAKDFSFDFKEIKATNFIYFYFLN